MNRIYTGSVTLAATEDFKLAEVEPPKLEGYGCRIVSAAFGIGGDDTANNGLICLAGLSVQVPVRTDFDLLSDYFAADLLGLSNVLFSTSYNNVSGQLEVLESAYRVPTPVFDDEVAIFVKTPAAVAATKTLSLVYQLELENVKLTASLLAEINGRRYS
jgi:hypothetical protein